MKAQKQIITFNKDNNDLVTCSLCGLVHTKDNTHTLHTVHGEQAICSACTEAYTTTLDSVDFFTTDMVVVIDGVAYSEEFANHFFAPCEHCGKLVIDVDRIDGRQICNDCFVANNN